LGSLALYILMRKRMHYLTEVKKWKRARAAWKYRKQTLTLKSIVCERRWNSAVRKWMQTHRQLRPTKRAQKNPRIISDCRLSDML